MTRLTQRDRFIVAEVLRAIVARDVKRRSIADTYAPDLLSISAAELTFFADEMRSCADGDNVELAEVCAQAWTDEELYGAEHPCLRRLEDAHGEVTLEEAHDV